MDTSIKEALQAASKLPPQYFNHQPYTDPGELPYEVQNFQELDYKSNQFNERENGCG